MKRIVIALVVIVILGLAAYFGYANYYKSTPTPTPSPTATIDADEYNPTIEPANFVSVVNNRYYTLTPGTTYTYESETEEGKEKNITVVTDKTKNILGVTTTVVWDRVWLDDELIEETYDWYAQDKDGNVWYMGEDSKEYENGKVTSAKGSWEAGVDGAKPGIIMKANPKIGDSYKQEYYQGEAEDMADIVSLNEKVAVSLGIYDDCLKTRDWSQIETSLNEHKYYCSDVGGMVLEVNIATGERTELISVSVGNKPTPTSSPTPTTTPQITSFAECAAAGYPIMESYPRQCRTPFGQSFTEEIDVTQESGIKGIVLLGPTCPVERVPPDPACAEKKYATKLAVTTTDQVMTITEFSSDANGVFNIGLPPGEYAIRSAVAANVLPYCSSDGIITVNANSYTQTTIHCDTGIR